MAASFSIGSLLATCICLMKIVFKGGVKSQYVRNKQKTSWKVLRTVFIHSLFRIIKVARSQSLARSFYPTSQLVKKKNIRHDVLSIYLQIPIPHAMSYCYQFI